VRNKLTTSHFYGFSDDGLPEMVKLLPVSDTLENETFNRSQNIIGNVLSIPSQVLVYNTLSILL